MDTKTNSAHLGLIEQLKSQLLSNHFMLRYHHQEKDFFFPGVGFALEHHL